VGRVQKYHQVSKVSFLKDEICIKMCLFYLHSYYPCHMLLIELLGPSCNSSSLPVDRKYQKRQSRDNYIILLGTDHLTCREGYGFFFVQKYFFRTTRELEYIFWIFFPQCNIRLYDKNFESDFFFSSTKIRIFFQQHWESEYFFLKKITYPPFKLNGRSLI
jgi:hypothetical protein